MKKIKNIFILHCIFFCAPQYTMGWGFHAHRLINKHAILILPEEMKFFYKKHFTKIKEESVNPDKRRFLIQGEECRHYIDLEFFLRIDGEIPSYWGDAVKKYGKEELTQHGILPWHIIRSYYWLVEAFKKGKVARIIKLSTDLGHYLADAHVPLHTTENYDGQLTGQVGVHGLWETSIPELFSYQYEYWIGKPYYIQDIRTTIWDIVWSSHNEVENVLTTMSKIKKELPTHQHYLFKKRSSTLKRDFSRKFASRYNQALDKKVETRLKEATLIVASVWYSAWVDAGKPNLYQMSNDSIILNKENFTIKGQAIEVRVQQDERKIK